MEDFEDHVGDGESRGALPITNVTVFWLATVSTFGTLYKKSSTSVYSKEDMVKKHHSNAHSCVNYLLSAFPDTEKSS